MRGILENGRRLLRMFLFTVKYGRPPAPGQRLSSQRRCLEAGKAVFIPSWTNISGPYAQH
jgi:hypothetical protein